MRHHARKTFCIGQEIELCTTPDFFEVVVFTHVRRLIHVSGVISEYPLGAYEYEQISVEKEA